VFGSAFKLAASEPERSFDTQPEARGASAPASAAAARLEVASLEVGLGRVRSGRWTPHTGKATGRACQWESERTLVTGTFTASGMALAPGPVRPGGVRRRWALAGWQPGSTSSSSSQ